jgi:response regulator of citrate/malate metabolism
MSVRILIAEEASVLKTVSDGLSDFDLLTTTKFSEAKEMIAGDGIGLFIIGVHFDESNATNLIGHIRRDKKHADVPILVVRLLGSKHEKTLRTTISSLVKVGTINQYLEVLERADAPTKIRRAVEQLLQGAIAKNQ